MSSPIYDAVIFFATLFSGFDIIIIFRSVKVFLVCSSKIWVEVIIKMYSVYIIIFNYLFYSVVDEISHIRFCGIVIESTIVF